MSRRLGTTFEASILERLIRQMLMLSLFFFFSVLYFANDIMELSDTNTLKEDSSIKTVTALISFQKAYNYMSKLGLKWPNQALEILCKELSVKKKALIMQIEDKLTREYVIERLYVKSQMNMGTSR
ncbi:hypothetical protein BD560DRAFT_425630 [Blakeslea trispora]|nr:hypothetical protein BD560DRAFT_425630 [Blakeslea trispora]